MSLKLSDTRVYEPNETQRLGQGEDLLRAAIRLGLLHCGRLFFRVEVLGFGVWGLGFRVEGLGLKVCGLGFGG